MFDPAILLVVIFVIAVRVYLMKGNFVLPTFYKDENKISFNLGSIGTIIIGVIAALSLAQTKPELFANWYVAGITAYSAPQIVDSIITKGTRIKYNSDTASEDIELEDIELEDIEPEDEIADLSYEESVSFDEEEDGGV